MKRLFKICRGGSADQLGREMRRSSGSEDRLAVMALVIGGLLLVSVCHYSLVQLSEFCGLVIAVLTAGRNQSPS